MLRTGATGENLPATVRLMNGLAQCAENVVSDGRTRREGARKRNLHTVNEHFESLQRSYVKRITNGLAVIGKLMGVGERFETVNPTILGKSFVAACTLPLVHEQI